VVEDRDVRVVASENGREGARSLHGGDVLGEHGVADHLVAAVDERRLAEPVGQVATAEDVVEQVPASSCSARKSAAATGSSVRSKPRPKRHGDPVKM
jgi:hypothetical protein